MLVPASTFIANRIGMSSVAPVVAVGTNALEFSASTDATLNDLTGLSVGNIVDSNVCNIIFAPTEDKLKLARQGGAGHWNIEVGPGLSERPVIEEAQGRRRTFQVLVARFYSMRR